jgi:WXXGXW repeat (2 copies)
MKCLVFLTTIVLSLSACVAHETYIVRERPVEVVYTRPPAPGPQHVWVSGDWVWENGGYRWHEGRWERRHEGVAWHDGYWKTTAHGYKWIPGRWS